MAISFASDGGGGAHKRVAVQQAVGAVESVEGSTVRVREGSKVRTYEVVPEGAATARSKLALAAAQRVKATIFFRTRDGRRMIERVEPHLPGGMKTFGDMQYEGLPAYPPVKGMQVGAKLENVPVTNVKLWDARAMARFHAAWYKDASPEELELLGGADGFAADARQVTLADLAKVSVGEPRSSVLASLGKPGQQATDVKAKTSCAYWQRADDPALTAAVCFDAAGRVASASPDATGATLSVDEMKEKSEAQRKQQERAMDATLAIARRPGAGRLLGP